LSFDVKEESGRLLVLLPDAEKLDEVIGTRKWMVRRETADVYGRGGAGQISIVGQDEGLAGSCGAKSLCQNREMEW
jgi:nitrite reductase (NAD(P)H)